MAIVASSVLASASATADGVSAPPTPAARAAAVAIDPKVGELWRDPVEMSSFARRTFYTWTTGEQIAALSNDLALFVREESPIHGASYFEQVVHALAQRGDRVAAVLDHAAFAKSRFAWPTAWQTREGWPGEHYGDQLIRITLANDAIVLALSTRTGAFTAADVDRAPVSIETVLAHPERIAAVYFEASPAATRGLPAASASYREYVLCNESMVAEWAVGSPDIAAELAREADAIDALAAALRGGVTVAQVQAEWARALAFVNPSYVLVPDALAQIASHLRATPTPSEHTIAAPKLWTGLGAVRKPPRVVPKRRNGTYGTY